MNFAYNYINNIRRLQHILITPYLKDGKIGQSRSETEDAAITTYFDVETDKAVAIVVETPYDIIFYEKGNQNKSEDNQSVYTDIQRNVESD